MNLVFDEKTKLFHPETYHITLFRVKKPCNEALDLSVVFNNNVDFGTLDVPIIDISTRFEYEEGN